MDYNMKKLSIITVCRNSEKTIERTIMSVIQQKTNDVEYLIIDGASSDSTCSIINSFSSLIDKCISEADAGISDAFNKGIKMASGEYIALLNSDDIYNEGAIKSILDAINQSDSYADILCFSMDINRDGSLQKVDSQSCRLNEGMYIAHPATIVKASVYKNIGAFDQRYKLSMDYDFLLRAKTHGYKFIDIKLPIVTMFDGGVSDLHPYRAVLECAKAYKQSGANTLQTWKFVFKYMSKRIVHHTIRNIK